MDQRGLISRVGGLIDSCREGTKGERRGLRGSLVGFNHWWDVRVDEENRESGNSPELVRQQPGDHLSMPWVSKVFRAHVLTDSSTGITGSCSLMSCSDPA